MSSGRRKRAQTVEHEADKGVGSGQITESLQRDVAAQPALLAAAAELVQQRAADASSAPATPKPSKKKAKATLAQLIDTMPTSTDLQTPNSAKRKDTKEFKAWIHLAKHMEGEKRGQLSGRAYYAISCAFADNKALSDIIFETHKMKPRWMQAIGAHVVECPTDKLAARLHSHLLTCTAQIGVTLKTLNKELDLSPYDNAAVTKYDMTLATSDMLETNEGLLPPSIMLVGKTYPFKEFLKDHFNTIKYRDLVFNGGTVTKSAWVLEVDAQTDATGTLAQFLESLGVKVTEVDVTDEDDDDEGDDEALMDDEADEDDPS